MHEWNEKRECTRCEPVPHGVAPPGGSHGVSNVEGVVDEVKRLTNVMVALSMHHIKEDKQCVEDSLTLVRRALVHKLLG